MEIEIVGSTNNFTNKEDVLDFSGAAARVCYSKFDFSKLVSEDKDKLIEMTLKSGHHSPYDHVSFNLYLKNIPKFGAMLLNNEKVYTTSEKSARYTKMKVSGKQKLLYTKWMDKLQPIIAGQYPQLDDVKVKKLAQENARYMTSVFTPTKMLYTTSFRQLNHLMHFFEGFIEEAEDNKFNQKTKEFMDKFNSALKHLYVSELNPSVKRRNLSLFAERKEFSEEFGESYSTNYLLSFAGLAQAHRHRTLNYEIQMVDVSDIQFFIPRIFQEEKSYLSLMTEWLDDLNVVSGDFPQATLLKVHEYGHHTDFISKMNERLCGHAQWEVMSQTKNTLTNYLDNTEDSNKEVFDKLSLYSNGPKCTFPEAKCASPCPFGTKLGLERLI